MEWSASDAALVRQLADRWEPLRTERQADLTIHIEATALSGEDHRRSLEPVTMLPSPDGGSSVRIRFGTLADVEWQVASHRMVCGYDATSFPRSAGGFLEIVFCWLARAWLTRQGRLVLHAAAILTGGAADLFTGPSGVGKTTLTDSVAAERVLHDDVVVLSQRDGSWWVTAGPHPHHGQWIHQAGRHWPVGRIFLLQREGASGVERMPGHQALARLFREGLYGFADAAGLYQQRLALLGAVVERHPCYRLRYRLHHESPWEFIASTSPSRAHPIAAGFSPQEV